MNDTGPAGSVPGRPSPIFRNVPGRELFGEIRPPDPFFDDSWNGFLFGRRVVLGGEKGARAIGYTFPSNEVIVPPTCADR